MWLFKKFFAIAVLLFAVGCADITVSPLATTQNGALSQINVVEVTGRDGQLYSRELERKLYVNGQQNPKFDLISRISVNSSSTLSVKGKSSTLKKMTMSVSLQLLDRLSGEVVLDENIVAGATLGAVTSYFGQDEAERHGRERLAKLLAGRAARRVLLFFATEGS